MEMKRSILILVLCAVSRFQLSMSTEKELLKHLNVVNNVPRFALPVLHVQDSINVTFGFELTQIIAFNEEDQSIKMKLWLRLSWFNQYINWDPHMFGGVTATQINQDEVWAPDVFVEEDIGQAMSRGNEQYSTKVTMEFNGRHTWLIPIILHSSCRINIEHFPFDRQNCALRFVSWSYDERKMRMLSDGRPIVTDKYVKSSIMELVNVEYVHESVSYHCCVHNFSTILFTMTLDRKPQYYLYHIILPCCFQIAILLFSFCLPPACGERVSVVVTILLVLAVYLQVLQSSLPKQSSSTPVLSQFYISSMGEAVVAFIATCIVITVYYHSLEKGVGRVPCWVRIIFIKYLGTLLFARRSCRNAKNAYNINTSAWENSTDGSAVVKSSTSVTSGIFCCNGVEKETLSTLIKREGMVNSLSQGLKIRHSTLTGNVKGKKNKHGQIKSNVRHEDPFAHSDSAQADEMKSADFTKIPRRCAKKDLIEEEWAMLLRVLDRFFFLVLLGSFLSSSVYYRLHLRLASCFDSSYPSF